jgi:hypothetical protein
MLAALPVSLFYNMRMDITLPELEQAINYWRAMRPSTGEERALSPEVDLLATVYAIMIFNRSRSLPLDSLDAPTRQVLENWRAQQG